MIQQIRVGADNFSYVIFDDVERGAALVDPGFSANAALEYIRVNKYKLLYIINTHHHGDHVADNARAKKETGAELIALERDGTAVGAERFVKDGEKILLGDVELEFMITPGHTPGSLCILVEGVALITGDTLFIGNCGRTDLGGGSDQDMWESLQRIKGLADNILIYSGHDYGNKAVNTLESEKKNNPTLAAVTFEEFLAIP
jgi:glyoxylase-like metal-dependent hydrolase (beta-lactamase superfamily II)